MSEFELNNNEASEEEISEISPETEEITEETTEERYVDTGSVAGSVLGGLVGMIIALLLCTVIHGIFGKTPYLTFFLFPLCICVMSLIFSGSLTKGGIITAAVFNFLGIIAYPAFSAACDSVLDRALSPLSVPLVALTQIGKTNLLSSFSFTSQFVYPIIIAIIGIVITWQIFKLKKAKLYD